MFAYEAIHLTGGNTFQFLHWLRRRNLMGGLKDYVYNGGILIGVSAGAILMTPDISTSLLCGDTLYAGKEDTTGLSLVDFAFAPHYDGTHAGRRELLEYSTTFEGDVYAVPDGGAVIVDDDQTEFFGGILIARKGVIVSE